MKLGIHESSWGFSQDWLTYCERKEIPYKIVDCYSSDIIQQLEDCNALLWHHHHTLTKDALFAKGLLFSLQQAGKIVFPDFNTGWHFDDKVGQKYLLEAIKAPLCPTYIFYNKQNALSWLNHQSFPKVFKLRGGAGSNNVKLVKNEKQGRNLIINAFGKGFPPYDRWGDLKETIRKNRIGKTNWVKIAKSIRRLFVSTEFARTLGPEKGYVLFQDFIPNNAFDIRIVTIGNRAFGIKRLVRKNDFRASGSGFIAYEKEEIDERCIKIAFETTENLKAQCIAYDFVFDTNGNPLIVEINYGYAHDAYFKCPGYWDCNLNWHEGSFNSADWILEQVLSHLKR